jgi:hypothetical protein
VSQVIISIFQRVNYLKIFYEFLKHILKNTSSFHFWNYFNQIKFVSTWVRAVFDWNTLFQHTPTVPQTHSLSHESRKKVKNFDKVRRPEVISRRFVKVYINIWIFAFTETRTFVFLCPNWWASADLLAEPEEMLTMRYNLVCLTRTFLVPWQFFIFLYCYSLSKETKILCLFPNNLFSH